MSLVQTETYFENKFDNMPLSPNSCKLGESNRTRNGSNLGPWTNEEKKSLEKLIDVDDDNDDDDDDDDDEDDDDTEKEDYNNNEEKEEEELVS